MGRLTEYFGAGAQHRSGRFGDAPVPEITVDANVEAEMQRALGRMMVSDKWLRSQIRKAISTELRKAAKNVRQDFRSNLGSDPRKAYLAVKSSVYKQILGGNISILNPRRAGARYKLSKPRKLDQNPHQRGGNRRKRSTRTEDIETYFGKDRAFILRFNNSGTTERQTRYGSRGQIQGRDIFSVSAGYQMNAAEKVLAKIVEEEAVKAFYNK